MIDLDFIKELPEEKQQEAQDLRDLLLADFNNLPVKDREIILSQFGKMTRKIIRYDKTNNEN